jgi:uncharacterized damage-inducible protein DinB
MKDFYKELFDYNNQVNQQLITAFNEHSGAVSEKSVQWLNHILNAHQVWISRIDKQQEPLSSWHVHSPGYLKDLDIANFKRSRDILNDYELGQVVSYTNSVGKSHSNSIKDILFHVINHSTYHRGQIASDFKNSDLKPLVSDYIAFKR